MVGAALVPIALAIAGYATGALRSLELNTVDTRFSIRGSQGAPSDVVVVAIDDVTFNDLGLHWPFPRAVHARLIDRLRAAGVRTIAYDVQFTEQTTPSQDNALVKALARTPRVVLSTTEVDDSGRTNILGGDDFLRSIGVHAGNALLPTDPGGVYRRFPYQASRLRSFGVVAAELFSGRPIGPGRFRDEGAWIDYRGGRGTVKTVSFSDVYRGRVPSSILRGTAVVVGATAVSLQDVHPTSFGSDTLMSGPEVQANVVSTVLRGLPLRSAPTAIDLLAMIALGLVTPLAALRLRPVVSALVALAAGALFALGVQLAFNWGWIVSFVYPLVSLTLSLGATLVAETFLGAIERAVVRDRFARFVPEAVVDEVLAREDLRLGGQRRTVTVMFSDIRGFTTFSETRSPDEVVEVLNRYLSAMSNVILDHGGTLISFMGDGIMAVFGAPVPQEDHADRAVAAAQEMAGETLTRFNEWLSDHGLPEGFRIGVGVNTGLVMVGNVGSERRVEYTAIGDTTNTAARLEALTKESPHMVFIAESTRSLLVRPAHDLVHVDDFGVRGKQARVSVWSFPAAKAAVNVSTRT